MRAQSLNKILVVAKVHCVTSCQKENRVQFNQGSQCHQDSVYTVNVDFLRIEYMVLAKYQHMSILELILLVKQHILILCKNLLGVAVLIIVN
jgi:hypothetical protein